MSKDKTITNMILVNLHISVDTCRRTLKKQAKNIAIDHSADENSISASFKMIKPELIKDFTTALSRCRTYYQEKTLPWEDGNWRVIPVDKMVDFKDKLDELVAECNDQFEKCFLNNYSELQRQFEINKGTLNLDFPKPEELEKKYKVSYNISSIAPTDDIRVTGINDALRDMIKEDMEKRYDEQITRGLMSLANKMLDSLDNLLERVSEDDQSGKRYGRYIINLKEMVETIEGLNISGNEIIDKACEEIRENIACWSPQAIKDTEAVREHIQYAASVVKNQLNNIVLED